MTNTPADTSTPDTSAPDTSTSDTSAPDTSTSDTVATFLAGRRLKLDPQRWREPGEPIPEAHTWHRLDSYLHTGYLKPVPMAEADFRAAVGEYCPELAEQIYGLLGLTADLPTDSAPAAVVPAGAIPPGAIYPAGERTKGRKR